MPSTPPASSNPPPKESAKLAVPAIQKPSPGDRLLQVFSRALTDPKKTASAPSPYWWDHDQFWPYIAQVCVGIFFTAAGYIKLTRSFFGSSEFPLSEALTYWQSLHLPIAGYAQLINILIPFSKTIAVVTILLQAIPGIMLVYNYRVRLAAVLLMFVQINIFLATFHMVRFNIFVGLSVWMTVFLYLRPGMTARQWRYLTYVFAFIAFVHIAERYRVGDAQLANVAWQRAAFLEETVSLHIALKEWVIRLTGMSFGPHVWASIWWLQLLLVAGLLSKYRLYIGAVWLALVIVLTAVWLNIVTAEGALWTLGIFLWLSHEHYWQTVQEPVVRSLYP